MHKGILKLWCAEAELNNIRLIIYSHLVTLTEDKNVFFVLSLKALLCRSQTAAELFTIVRPLTPAYENIGMFCRYFINALHDLAKPIICTSAVSLLH